MTTISGALNLHTMIVVISVSTLSRIHWPGYALYCDSRTQGSRGVTECKGAVWAIAVLSLPG